MYAGDATELDHPEVVWNVCSEITDRLSNFMELYRAKDHVKLEGPDGDYIMETVRLLGILRAACVEIKRIREGPSASHYQWLKYLPENWRDMVKDIDRILHEYRHRDDEHPPRFRFAGLDSTGKDTAGTAQVDSGDQSSDDEEHKTEYSGKFRLDPAFQAVEDRIHALQYVKQNEEDLVVSDSVVLEVGDNVHLRLCTRRACATVEKIADKKKFLFVTYEGLPSSFDEFQPYKQVRGSVGAPQDFFPTALRPAISNDSLSPQLVRCAPSVTPGVVSIPPASCLLTSCLSRSMCFAVLASSGKPKSSRLQRERSTWSTSPSAARVSADGFVEILSYERLVLVQATSRSAPEVS